MRRLGLALLGLAACFYAPPVHAQAPVIPWCVTGGTPPFAPCSATYPLAVSASVSASVTGFAPGLAYATLTATDTSASVALPTGTVVLFQNTGTTAVSCTLGIGSATAVASQNIIQPSSWMSFTVGSNTFGACINQSGSTSNVVVLSGGSGIATGSGGGGGSGGSVTNTASVASWSTGTALNTVVTITSAGQYPANQLTLSASALVTAGVITFQGTKADGTDETIPVAQVLNPNTLAPLTNPYTLTTSKQDFLILTQGYQTIKAKLTTAITASGGAATTVISNTNLPYNPTISALLNPLAAGSAIIGKVGIDQTTPGTTNAVATFNSGGKYETIAASQTGQTMGPTGATGDYLSHCTVYPTSTSPGVVTVFDSTSSATNNVITFAGGSSSITNLVPFTFPVGAFSVNGAWKVTTGANLVAICYGKFT